VDLTNEQWAVLERCWFGSFRRLVVRYERRADNFLGFTHLGCIVILLRRLLECLRGNTRRVQRATLASK
jgi:hypothetical protein